MFEILEKGLSLNLNYNIMLPPFSEIKNEALQKLDKNWGNSIAAILIIGIISGVAGFVPGGGLVVGGPFALGMAAYFIKVSRGQSVELNSIFDGFKNFGNALGVYILTLLVVIGFTLLLIIPGIIAALALSQTYRIMCDNPGIGITDAMRKSRDMMNGYKMDYFLLNLSFIGWAFLCILTLGLGFLVLAPYVVTSNTIFYNHISSYNDKQIELIGEELTQS
jgi:uncharacterized membrane protein